MSDPAEGAAQEAKGVATNALTLLAQAAMPAFHVQLARYLGVAGYGTYVWSNMVVDFLSLVSLCGMDLYVTREVGAAHARRDTDASARVVGAALRVVTLSGLAMSAVVFVAAPWIAARDGQADALAPLRILSLVPVFFHAATLLLVATQARMEMRYDFITRGLFQPLALLALTSVALRVWGTVGAAAGAVVLGMALTSGVAMWGYSRELPLRATLREAVFARTDWGAIRSALPYVATNFVWAASGRIDGFALKHYAGSAEMGAYAACALYVVSISQTRGAFVPVITARLPGLLRAGDTAGVQAVVARQNRWCAITVLPLVVLFGGLGDPLLRVFGRSFSAGATAMAVLTLGHFVSAVSLAAYVIPMGRRPWLSTLCAGLSVGVQALILPLLVRRYGLTGAAVASATGLVIAQLGQGILAWSVFRVHGLSQGFAKAVLAALAALVVARVTYAAFDLHLVARFLLAATLAALTYVGGLAALGLDPEDRALLPARLRGVRP